MKELIKLRVKNVLSNEVGASNVEVIIWIAVVLLVAVVLKYAIGYGLGYKTACEAQSVHGLIICNNWNAAAY